MLYIKKLIVKLTSLKKMIAICMLFGCGNLSFAANLNDATKQARASFEKQYPCALYATWETMEDNNTYAVRFVNNNQSFVAYYNEDGVTIGFARLITIDTLPEKVQETLSTVFIDYKVLSVQEVVVYNKHLFYFDIVNKEEKLFISINNNGRIKQRKKV